MILYDNKGAVYSAVHAHVLPAQLSAIAIEIKPVGILNIPVDPSRFSSGWGRGYFHTNSIGF